LILRRAAGRRQGARTGGREPPDPAELGEFCAYLCSAHVGYISGQNLLIDGGNYPGTL
jgi:3-oxoacyl-[acyl-carrier protein] reductase